MSEIFKFQRADWMQQRACVDKPVSFFFPAPKQSPATYQAIRDVCAACPVQSECLNHALENAQTFGWWGGYSEAQRRAMRSGRPRRPREFKERVRGPVRHGTVAGRSAHIYRKEPVCDECREAWNARKRMLRQRGAA